MVEHQGPRRHARVQILVNGRDITHRVFPYLISVQVTDTLEGGTDQCHLELDDRNAELQIPPDNASLQVSMGWAGEGPRLFDLGRNSKAGGQGPLQMSPEEIKQEAKFGGPGMRLIFDGWVTNVESGFGRRGGGRRMWIEGEGHDSKGQNKEVQQGSMGEGKQEDGQDGKKVPLKDVMTKVFGFAGASVVMDKEMEKISRDYWHYNDSAMNFGKRIAQETGGFFKISKDTAILISKSGKTNATGDDMPTVEAIWGINLIGWRIKPYIGRTQYGASQGRFFDILKGKWEDVQSTIAAETPFGGTAAVAHAAQVATDKAQAEQENKGSEGDVENRRGTGWVLLNGEPNAKAGGFVRIDGARPGVDGTYRISEAEHNYTRGVGYTTRCQVIKPDLESSDFGWRQGTKIVVPPGSGTGATPDDLTPAFEEGESWNPEDAAEAEAERLRQEARKKEAERLRLEQLRLDWMQRPWLNPAAPPLEGAQAPDAPSPPISGEQTYTAEELAVIRQAEEDRLRNALQQPPETGESWEPTPAQSTDPTAPGYVPAPPISGEQTFTAQELETIRQNEIARQNALQTEGYQSGQSGEGGIAFPE